MFSLLKNRNLTLMMIWMKDRTKLISNATDPKEVGERQQRQQFCFPRISMFPEAKSKETLRFEGNKSHCSPRDQSLSDLLYSKATGSNRWKTNNHVFDKWRATAVNISRVTVNCFPFDVIVFAMLPAQDIWRETVSLLDVMWQWTGQWMGAL